MAISGSRERCSRARWFLNGAPRFSVSVANRRLVKKFALRVQSNDRGCHLVLSWGKRLGREPYQYSPSREDAATNVAFVQEHSAHGR
jgi:hypothetical protein